VRLSQPAVRLSQPALSRGEALAQVLDDGRPRLYPDAAKRQFEVGNNGRSEGGIGLGALDEHTELDASQREFLRCSYPAGRSRREHAKQLTETLFVVCRHLVTYSLDGGAGVFLPSSLERSCPRQREILLAIVPAGIPSSSPIVR
jgi:hypothetical protein